MYEFSTAVVIVAPHQVQAIAIPIIRRYWPDSLIRYRPHMTLMYPFVPFGELDEACQKIEDLAQDIAPFEVALDGYGRFPGTIYMKPSDPAPILEVFQQLYAAFPDYPPYEGKFGETLQPHITLAQYGNGAAQPIISLPDYAPQRFMVDRLHLWYGQKDADLPWLTYDVIRLRGGSNRHSGQ